LDVTQRFLQQITREGKRILFVGSEPHTKQITEERALASQSFFVKGRWLGGTLTNLSTIQISLSQLSRLEQDESTGAWANLTRKHITLLRKKLYRKQQLKGLIGIQSIPRAVVIFTQKANQIAIQECHKLKIPTISLLDTNCDPKRADIGIPMNDDSKARIQLFLETILPSIYEGRRWWLSIKVKKQLKKVSNG
jgi:small subunit ribosomal protein S2